MTFRFGTLAAGVLLSIGLLGGPASGADFYVAPNGSDSGPGTEQKPFGTIGRAEQAVRQLKSRQPQRNTPVRISIRGGFYALAEPIVFRPEDSGTAAAPIVYEAAPGERPIFSGGRLLRGWKVGKDSRWRVTLADVKAGNWNFSQLFVNDQRRFTPRLPKTGYYTVAEEVKPAEGARGYTQFGFHAGDINPRWANRDDVVVQSFHIWCDSQMRIASIDDQKRVVTFTGRRAARPTTRHTARAIATWSRM